MKQRLLTISINTRYRVIFASSAGKVREFHVVWKVVTLVPAECRHSNHSPVTTTCHLVVDCLLSLSVDLRPIKVKSTAIVDVKAPAQCSGAKDRQSNGKLATASIVTPTA